MLVLEGSKITFLINGKADIKPTPLDLSYDVVHL